jgi:hypothetical protein
MDEVGLFHAQLSGHAMNALGDEFEPARAEQIAARLNAGQWRLRAEFTATPTGDIDPNSCRWCVDVAGDGEVLEKGWTLVTSVSWRKFCIHGGDTEPVWPDCNCTERVLAAADSERAYRRGRGPDSPHVP